MRRGVQRRISGEVGVVHLLLYGQNKEYRIFPFVRILLRGDTIPFTCLFLTPPVGWGKSWDFGSFSLKSNARAGPFGLTWCFSKACVRGDARNQNKDARQVILDRINGFVVQFPNDTQH